MAKKVVDPRATALEALSRALTDPAPKIAFGSAKVPGFFSGSTQAVKDAFKVCVESGWLEPTGERAGKGAAAKEKYRITAHGISAVLEASEPLDLLRGLAGSLKNQVDALHAIQENVGLALKSVAPLAQSVLALENRFQPPSLEEIRQKLGASKPAGQTTLPGSSSAWLDRVIPLAAEQRQRDRFQPLSLPALFQELRHNYPDLSLGQYHDGLRTLRDTGRIRLVPFTRALATIDDPRNALFLDGEVMYYVDLP